MWHQRSWMFYMKQYMYVYMYNSKCFVDELKDNELFKENELRIDQICL